MHTFFVVMLIVVCSTWLVWRAAVGELFNINVDNPRTTPIMMVTYLVLWFTAIIGFIVTK